MANSGEKGTPLKWKETLPAVGDIGEFGKRLVACSLDAAKKTVVLRDQKIEKGTRALVGSRVRLIFNEPLPFHERTVRIKGKETVERYQIDIDDLYQIVLKFDTVLDQLYADYPEWNCSRSRNSPMNMFVIGNSASNANVGNNAAAFSNASHCYLSPQITVAHNYFGFILTSVHEMTHGIDPSPRDPAWGNGFGESIARFSEYTYCPGTGNGYSCINAYYSVLCGHSNRNAYSKESLTYQSRETFIGYNPTFWIFFAARYGMQTYKRLIATGMANIIRTKDLYQGVAQFLNLDKNAFALQWMVDMMTLSFYRSDPIRLANAKRFLLNRDMRKTCVSEDLVWKDSQHNDLEDVQVVTGVSFTGTMKKRKLEAFAFATFDLSYMCRDIIKAAPGSNVHVSVQSVDDSTKENDKNTWALAGIMSYENIVTSNNNNNTLILALPAGQRCTLGVIHSKVAGFVDRNTASGTATAYTINITINNNKQSINNNQ